MSQSIPNYELYGDLLAGQAPDPIHLEPIRERSSQHNWKIRVHSHKRLAQIFLFRSPGVQFSVGEIEYLTTHPTLLVVHPGTPHGFRFAEDVVGDVLSIRLGHVPDALRKRFRAFKTPTSAIFPEPHTPRFQAVVALFEQLGSAYHSLDDKRPAIMTALVDLIMLYLVSEQSTTLSPAPRNLATYRGRQDRQAEAFCTLLEENFRKSWAVADYASHMGLSAPHLTRICRTALGAPPNSIVRQRRILEAKRLLEYTALPLSEIAHRSGFRDTAFFSRTFKSLVGIAPNAFRHSVDR